MIVDYLRGFKTRPACLADILPWATVLDKGVVRCKDESLFAVWQLDPLDLASLSPHEQGRVMVQLNAMWKHLDANCGLWMDSVRRPAHLPPRSILPYALADAIDRDHVATYAMQLFENRTYLTWWRRPATPVLSELSTWLTPQTHETPRLPIESFWHEASALVDVLRSSVRSLVPLTDDALATYLHGLISDHWSAMRMPGPGMPLDYALSDVGLLPGWSPMLGSHHLRLISVKGFGEETQVGLLADLLRCPYGMRCVTRWLPQSRERLQRQFTKRQERWSAKGTKLKDAALAWAFQLNSPGLKNRYAEHQADDTDAARFAMLTDDVGFGDFSLTIVLSDPDAQVVERHARDVLTRLRLHGLVAVDEHVNAVEAWLGTLPGMPLVNPRRFRLSSMNALHLGPWHAPWRGKPSLPSRYTPQPLLAKTDGCNPFWLALHADDVPHTLVAGPTGSGKSTLLKFLGMRAPRLFYFDVKRSARLMILCLGGTYHDLSREAIAFQPLRDIHDRRDRAEAYQWLKDRLEAAGIRLIDGLDGYVQESLRRLSGAPMTQRTMTELDLVMSQQSRHLQLNAPPAAINPVTGARDYNERNKALNGHKAIREALRPYLRDGLYGHLFDADHDDLGSHPIQGFELLGLFDQPELLTAVEAHIWRRLFPLFDGTPTLVCMDEMGEQLKYPVIRQWVDRGLRLSREFNVGFLLATQNHLDFVDSAIGPMLLTNCLTRLLLPNPNALADDVRPSYEALGLNAHEIEHHLAGATPKRDVYWVCPEGRRLLHLPMAPLAAAICAPSSPEVQAEIDTILAREGPEGFPQAWMRHMGVRSEGLACHG